MIWADRSGRAKRRAKKRHDTEKQASAEREKRDSVRADGAGRLRGDFLSAAAQALVCRDFRGFGCGFFGAGRKRDGGASKGKAPQPGLSGFDGQPADLWRMRDDDAADSGEPAGRGIEIEPIAHEGAVLDGEVYWIDARLNGRQIALCDLNVQYGADSGWDYIAEYDDYKLTQANLRDPQESRLFLDVGCADRLTLIFTQNAYGAGARIWLDSDTKEVVSLYTQEDEQTCSLEIPAGEYGRIWRFVITIGVAAGGWGLALLLLEALWDRHAGRRIACWMNRGVCAFKRAGLRSAQ